MLLAAETLVKYFQKLKLVCTSNVAHTFASFASMGIYERPISFFSFIHKETIKDVQVLFLDSALFGQIPLTRNIIN